MSDDLSAFLTARLDEDAAVVAEGWVNGGGQWWRLRLAGDPAESAWVDQALVDLARVLAEVEAKRRILAIHQRSTENGGELLPECSKCMSWETGVTPDDELDTYAEYDSWPCDTVKALASVYADHPDYRQEWRPEKLSSHD